MASDSRKESRRLYNQRLANKKASATSSINTKTIDLSKNPERVWIKKANSEFSLLNCVSKEAEVEPLSGKYLRGLKCLKYKKRFGVKTSEYDKKELNSGTHYRVDPEGNSKTVNIYSKDGELSHKLGPGDIVVRTDDNIYTRNLPGSNEKDPIQNMCKKRKW